MDAQARPGGGARARRGSSDAAGLSGCKGLRSHLSGGWNRGPGNPAARADRGCQVRFRTAMKADFALTSIKWRIRAHLRRSVCSAGYYHGRGASPAAPVPPPTGRSCQRQVSGQQSIFVGGWVTGLRISCCSVWSTPQGGRLLFWPSRMKAISGQIMAPNCMGVTSSMVGRGFVPKYRSCCVCLLERHHILLCQGGPERHAGVPCCLRR